MFNYTGTLLSLLRILSLGRIGSTKLVLPKWQKIGILNRDRRVACLGARAALVASLLNYVPWCYLARNNDLISQRDNKERNANSNALARLVIYNL